MNKREILKFVKKINKKKYIVLASLVLLVLISYLIIQASLKPENKAESSACMDLKTTVLAEIDKMNFCQTANDCVLINGCPYGCNNLVNKDAEWGALNELSFDFVDKCGECDEICQGALKSGEISCEAGKCKSLRIK